MRTLQLAGQDDRPKFKIGSIARKTLKGWYDNLIGIPFNAIYGNNAGAVIGNLVNKPYGGGRSGGGGAETRIGSYQWDEIIPQDTIYVPVRETFNDAFAKARRQGKQTFMFDGKLYGTELGPNPNWKAAGDRRSVKSLIPIITPADTIHHTTPISRRSSRW